MTKTRFSRTNGKATRLSKPFTTGSVMFVINNAGKITAKNIAEILHRPVSQVRTVARKYGVSLSVNA